MDFTTEITTGMIWKAFLADIWEIISLIAWWSIRGLYNFEDPILTIFEYIIWGTVIIYTIIYSKKKRKSKQDKESDIEPR